ncbi:MAG: ATP-dependent Clp protease adaptor ClpS [Gemmataceae bacterium]
MNESPADRPTPPSTSSSARKPARQLDRPPARSLPRYKLILHRNPTLDLMFVVRSVMELTRFPRAEATYKMWEAHHNGRSLLLTTWLERAELFVEQFASKGLITSIESL